MAWVYYCFCFSNQFKLHYIVIVIFNPYVTSLSIITVFFFSCFYCMNVYPETGTLMLHSASWSSWSFLIEKSVSLSLVRPALKNCSSNFII